MKVCVIYGSESGNSERAVKAIAKSWQGSNFEIGEIMEGATAAVRGFAALAEQYDFLVVACLLYTSPSPRDGLLSRMPSSA